MLSRIVGLQPGCGLKTCPGDVALELIERSLKESCMFPHNTLCKHFRSVQNYRNCKQLTFDVVWWNVDPFLPQSPVIIYSLTRERQHRTVLASQPNGRVRSQLDFHVEVDIWSSGRQVQSLCRSVMLPWKMILAEVGSLASENPNPAGYIWALWTYCEPAGWRNLVSAMLYLHIRPFYVALASFSSWFGLVTESQGPTWTFGFGTQAMPKSSSRMWPRNIREELKPCQWSMLSKRNTLINHESARLGAVEKRL